MPRYEYECQECHHQFEVRQSFASEAVANCPVCGNGARRMIHSVPVMFKGRGFYVNDYGQGGRDSTASSSPKESETGKDSKSESKAKAEAKSSSKVESSKGSDKGSDKQSASTK